MIYYNSHELINNELVILPGNHPINGGELIGERACLSYNGNACYLTYDVDIKDCITFYAYKLKQSACPSAYCFGNWQIKL